VDRIFRIQDPARRHILVGYLLGAQAVGSDVSPDLVHRATFDDVIASDAKEGKFHGGTFPIWRYVYLNAFEGSFDGRGQRVVIGVEYEDSEQLCRLGLARVAADRMDRARRFGPALTRPIDVRLAVIHLRFDRARNHIGVDERRLRVGMGHGGRAGA